MLEAQNHTLAKKLSAETDKRSQLEQALTTARAQASQAQAQLAPLQAAAPSRKTHLETLPYSSGWIRSPPKPRSGKPG
ncbi:hypothetical protein B6E78_00965 [Edwardsiella ictaluri]|nr:hypothetical protein B6E78_00965 [Edwardsiella ictaluri]